LTIDFRSSHCAGPKIVCVFHGHCLHLVAVGIIIIV